MDGSHNAESGSTSAPQQALLRGQRFRRGRSLNEKPGCRTIRFRILDVALQRVYSSVSTRPVVIAGYPQA